MTKRNKTRSKTPIVKKNSERKKFFFESFLATLLVYLVIWILSLISKISIAPFDYISKTISEFNLNDLYFSSLSNNQIDTNIIIVNIEDIGRNEIAQVLESVSHAQPAVVGLDVFFSAHYNSEYDTLLFNVFEKMKDKLVFATHYDENGSEDTDYWYLPDMYHGHAGILSNERNTAVVRYFQPYITSKTGEKIWSFSAEIVKLFDETKFSQLKKRDNSREFVNYTGNMYSFRIVNYRDLLDDTLFDNSFMKDKIVMIGYCGGKMQGANDLNDIFYTPVGFETDPNRRPDMFGIVLHSNIVSMLVHENYIKSFPRWILYIISFLLVYIHIFFFVHCYVKRQLYYQIFVRIVQLISFTFLLWLFFIVFRHFQINISSAYILVPVILAVDVLNLYEALSVFFYKKLKIKSIFVEAIMNKKID